MYEPLCFLPGRIPLHITETGLITAISSWQESYVCTQVTANINEMSLWSYPYCAWLTFIDAVGCKLHFQ